MKRLFAFLLSIFILVSVSVGFTSCSSADNDNTTTTTVAQTEKISEEEAAEEEKVPLITLCPTYEYFLDSLEHGVSDEKNSVADDGEHVVASFTYNGYSFVITYLNSEPHYMNSISIMDGTTSYSDHWLNTVPNNVFKLLYLYLVEVPNSLSPDDLSEKLSSRTETKEEEYMFTGELNYSSNGIKYYISLGLGKTKNSAAVYTASVEIDETYMVNKPEDYTETTTELQTEAEEASNSPNQSDNKQEETTLSVGNGSDNRSNANSSSANTASVGNCSNGHNWVEVTKKVHHKEEGHYENVKTGENKITIYHCPECSETFDSYNAYTSHFQKHINEDPYTKYIMDSYTKTYEYEPIYEKQWIVDAEAYDETVVTGYKCSVCGKTK